jgi:hypothetical protein
MAAWAAETCSHALINSQLIDSYLLLWPAGVSRRKQMYTSRFSHNGMASLKFETWISSTDFRKKPLNIKFHENPSVGS